MTKPPKNPGDYEIGYCRPPVASRFQPGKSGNPRGRPKGIKSFGQAIAESLQQRITVQEGDRQVKMRKQDVIVRGLVNDAARREPWAMKLLFALIGRYCDTDQQQAGPEILLPNDKAIIDAFLGSLESPKGAAESAAPAADQPEPDRESGTASSPEKEGHHDA